MSTDLQELVELARELKALLQDLQTEDLPKVEEKLKSIHRAFTMYFALAQRGGLPENVRQMVVELQKIRIAAMMAYRNLQLLQTALAVGGPVNWLLAAGGVALTGLMMGDYFYDAGRGR